MGKQILMGLTKQRKEKQNQNPFLSGASDHMSGQAASGFNPTVSKAGNRAVFAGPGTAVNLSATCQCQQEGI